MGRTKPTRASAQSSRASSEATTVKMEDALEMGTPNDKKINMSPSRARTLQKARESKAAKQAVALNQKVEDGHIIPEANRAIPTNGRYVGRKLNAWKPINDQVLLLVMYHEFRMHNIEIPWQAIATRYAGDKGTSGNAMEQHMKKLETKLLRSGCWVPPRITKSMDPTKNVRGFVMDLDENGEEYERVVEWDENLDPIYNRVEGEVSTRQKKTHSALTPAKSPAVGGSVRGIASTRGRRSATVEKMLDYNSDSGSSYDPRGTPTPTKKGSLRKSAGKTQDRSSSSKSNKKNFGCFIKRDGVNDPVARLLKFESDEEEHSERKILRIQADERVLEKFPAGIAGRGDDEYDDHEVVYANSAISPNALMYQIMSREMSIETDITETTHADTDAEQEGWGDVEPIMKVQPQPAVDRTPTKPKAHVVAAMPAARAPTTPQSYQKHGGFSAGVSYSDDLVFAPHSSLKHVQNGQSIGELNTYASPGLSSNLGQLHLAQDMNEYAGGSVKKMKLKLKNPLQHEFIQSPYSHKFGNMGAMSGIHLGASHSGGATSYMDVGETGVDEYGTHSYMGDYADMGNDGFVINGPKYSPFSNSFGNTQHSASMGNCGPFHLDKQHGNLPAAGIFNHPGYRSANNTSNSYGSTGYEADDVDEQAEMDLQIEQACAGHVMATGYEDSSDDTTPESTQSANDAQSAFDHAEAEHNVDIPATGGLDSDNMFGHSIFDEEAMYDMDRDN